MISPWLNRTLHPGLAPRENHFVKIANALSSESPVINGELYTALLFKPTAN
jgi:hypothetical protein